MGSQQLALKFEVKTMEHLIKLRHLSSSLSSDEFYEFLIKQGKGTIVQTALQKALFDAFVALLQNADDLNEINDVIIPKVSDMNQCIVSIIRSRKKKKKINKHNQAKKKMSVSPLERLPNENICDIASYLSPLLLNKFERCSRTLFIAVRSAPLSNRMSLYRLFRDY